LDDDERQVGLQHRIAFADSHRTESQDNSAEAAAEFDTLISKLNADIERMAPNMKAIDRCVIRLLSLMRYR